MTIAGTQQKEYLAVEYGAKATHAMLCTADPGTSITNEVSGGSYVRKALAWTAGSVDGVVTVSVTFDVPASTAVTHAVLTTGSSGATTFLDKVAVTYNSQPSAGTLTVNFTYTQS